MYVCDIFVSFNSSCDIHVHAIHAIWNTAVFKLVSEKSHTMFFNDRIFFFFFLMPLDLKLIVHYTLWPFNQNCFEILSVDRDPEIFQPDASFCPGNGMVSFRDGPPLLTPSCVPAPGPVQCHLQSMNIKQILVVYWPDGILGEKVNHCACVTLSP